MGKIISQEEFFIKEVLENKYLRDSESARGSARRKMNKSHPSGEKIKEKFSFIQSTG